MMEFPPWLLGIAILCGLLIQVPAGLLLDQLLRYEYEFHPEAWDADGRPSGFLWCPPSAEWFDTATWNRYFYYRWIFKTPSWIRSEPRCLEKLRLIRFLHVLGIFLFISVLLYLII